MVAKGKLSAALATALLAASPMAAKAHHSFAVFFDPDKPVSITGKVTAFRFTNPHGTIALEVKRADGSVETWHVETNAPVVLRRRGWTPSSIKPGEVITVDGWLARDGRHYMRLRAAKDAEGHPIGASPFGQGDE